ncbi:MAG: hypothetical protein KatS3mg103_0452 [Phycisphaerales bacterium]|nr:MAG: hypothetical protein KatS3mg103_0452 [Phycisphaerales bacterium]
MTTDELRAALKELTGGRDATFAFHSSREQSALLLVHNAMLVPEESDQMIKLTDGQSIFIIDAHSVAWVRIGPPQLNP